MSSLRLLICLTLSALCLSLAHAAGVQGVMMVVKGDIKVTTPDGKTETAKVGRKVGPGDTIIAGPDSRAKIVMADKNVINISPDSKIVIEKYENDGKDKKNVELNVLYGKVRASVEQKYDGDKSKFNVKTPSAVAGVRGTDFLTSYNSGTKTAQVITFNGSVAVGQPGPGGSIQNPVFVKAGQMTQAGSGQAPEAPKSVPKEELNQMNSETKAESSGNSKSDSEPTANSDAKGDEKKDEKKEEKKDDKKEASKDDPKQDKKDDKKKDDKREPASEGQDKSKETKGDRKDESKGDKSADKKGGERAPSSVGPGGMISAGDLPGGPGGGGMMPTLANGPMIPLIIPVTQPITDIPKAITEPIKVPQKTTLTITVKAP